MAARVGTGLTAQAKVDPSNCADPVPTGTAASRELRTTFASPDLGNVSHMPLANHIDRMNLRRPKLENDHAKACPEGIVP
jgi:hypothetical protein